MFSSVNVQRLSFGTVYKLWLIGLTTSLVPLGAFFGVLSFFGLSTVKWNGQNLYGVAGLLAGPFVGLFVALAFTAFLGSAAALGLWLYSKFRPMNLQVKNLT